MGNSKNIWNNHRPRPSVRAQYATIVIARAVKLAEVETTNVANAREAAKVHWQDRTTRLIKIKERVQEDLCNTLESNPHERVKP
jgi:hypothetical protein